MSTELEIILLGTGTSGTVPNLPCLVNHLSPTPLPPCRTCLSTLLPEGSKNVRRNTSAVVRGARPDGSKSTLLVDCGKSFLGSAMEFFPKHGIRHIDAVLLTHPHADAINGLDDLRQWTLRGVVQPCIKVYLSAHTLSEIARSWPYMVEKSQATGGGDVPAFEWNVIHEEQDFFVEGIRISPLNVHHGRFFPAPGAPVDEPIRPFYCLGFLFHPSIIYLGDVSFIPEEVWSKLRLTASSNNALSAASIDPSLPTPPASPPFTPGSDLDSSLTLSTLSLSNLSSSSSTVSSPDGASTSSNSPSTRYPVLILDCLFLDRHPSHFGIFQALSTVLRLNPLRTYLTGFAHHHSHAEWEALGEELAGTRAPLVEEPFVRRALSMAGEVGDECRKRRVFVRPAFDGLRVVCDAKGTSASEEEIDLVVDETRAVDLNELARSLNRAGQAGQEVCDLEKVQRGAAHVDRCCCP